MSENDVAIVGMAARLPGARTVDEFWENLRSGKESVAWYTDEELAAAGEVSARLRRPNYIRAGCPLQGMELFDGEFFGFSPKECAILDPQHRHFLECAWEALEDAGHPPERFEGPVGVFAGCGMGSYFYFNLCTNRELVDSVGLFLLRHTGNDKDFLATRVSYLLDLKGPSMNVQTACSTSLVAVHLASQSLLNGECDMALAGGVTIEIPHRRGYLYEDGEILSPDGHCHAFDHRGQGTIFGSGVGVVVLRRLQDAIEDRDHIHAVIRGSAVNNDGASKVGYLAPSVDGQAAAMTEALSLAEVSADTIDYVECHGTGTYMGDPIELSALTQAFRQSSNRNQYCRIGSVKTNIGHLDTAAGVASLIKASLALSHGEMPPSLNYEQPNPNIDFESSPFVVNDQLTPWARSQHPRRAGVNSLGVGGTNAYVVLEEAPDRVQSTSSSRPCQVLLLSGRNRTALDENTARLAEHLRKYPEQDLADVAWTLSAGRRAFAHRRVVAAVDHAEAASLLEEKDPRRVFTHVAAESSPSVAFLLPGGGSQYPRMAADLYSTEPVFRDAIDRGLEALKQLSGPDLREFFFGDPAQDGELGPRLAQMPAQLPAIFIVEYALARLWKHWGVEPEVLIGHSLGENTAACLAGVMTFEETLGLVLLRGQLFDRVKGTGMLSVGMSEERLKPLLDDELDIAVINSSDVTVVSGTLEAIARLEAQLADDEDVEVQRLDIPVAAHSRRLAPILDEFRAHLKTLDLRPPKLPFISNRSGTWITDQEATDPDYWVEHLRHTVRFAEGMGKVLEGGPRLLVEVGPGRTLCSLARQHPASTPQLVAINSLRHRDETVSDLAYFHAALGRVWAGGGPFDPLRFFEGEQRRRVRLPTYGFQQQPYFIQPGSQVATDEDEQALTKIEDPEQWGYEPTWQPQLPQRASEPVRPPVSTWLLFMDDAGIGRRLAAQLREDGHQVVEVRPGDSYSRRSDREYTLSPERGREGYDVLLKDLVAAGKAPSHVVHLWMLTASETFRPGSSFFHQNQERGFYSLLHLAQALADDSTPRPVRVTVVSNGMQRVGDEVLRYPEKATCLGPIRVAPKELPDTTWSSIDVELPSKPRLLSLRRSKGQRTPSLWRSMRQMASPARHGLDDVATAVLEDLMAEPGNRIVAYREGRRWEQNYQRAPLGARGDALVREGGTYLITGGLGGLGLVAARELAKTPRVKLVLVGRTAVPGRTEWDRWLRSHAGDDSTSRKIRAIRELEAEGAEVLASAADVTNPEEMNGVVEAARARFGPIRGVVHAAGAIRDDFIQVKTVADVETVFAPKVHGTVVLESLFAKSDLDFMLLYSSTSVVTAPVGQVDYVAANAFLDAYAQSHVGERTKLIAVNWGIWNEVGMAAEAVGPAPPPPAALSRPTAHPLFDRRVPDGDHTALASEYRTGSLWFLDEHRTRKGQALVPGTGYIEIARAALREYDENGPFELRNLFFLRPLAVDDGESKEVRVRLRRAQEGYSFEIRSERNVEGQRGFQLHAVASVALGDLPTPSPLPLSEIEARCTQDRQQDEHGIRSPQEAHLNFGPRWRVLRRIGYGTGEAIAKVSLPKPYLEDLGAYGLHPAMLDMATGFAMGLIEGYEGKELWVPVSYGRVRVWDYLRPTVYSWARSRGNNRADADFAQFDVTICDAEGRVLVEVEEFAIKRLPPEAGFGAETGASTADVEPERAGTSEEHLSPAQRALKDNLAQGILPAEGAAVLRQLLSADTPANTVVSSMDLPGLVAQTEALARNAAGPTTKFARPDLDSDYVEPRDDLEHTLASYWEELLGVERIGVRDSFFDLGGHSLIAVRLFSKMKKTFDVDFPISVLFEAPTIERCAELVRRELGEVAETASSESAAGTRVSRTRYTHLVPMHAGEASTFPPFFLVAGMFGNVLNLRHLANLIGKDRPFYGLQARGLYGDQEPHESFEEMAEAYLAELRTVQPHGPYYLGGFSGGGLTALEMAHQLMREEERVALLVMLDTPLPHSAPLTLRDKAQIHIQRFSERGPAYLGDWAQSRWAWEVGKLRSRFSEPEEIPEDTFHNDAIERAFRTALEKYKVEFYPGTVTLFRPRLDRAYVLSPDRVLSSELEWVYRDNGWGDHAADVRVFEVPGDHDSMVLEPSVRVLAEKLRMCIEEASQAESSSPRASSNPSTVVVSAE